ncbi:MAG: hypothetical protein GXP28_01255 [Planctomycetes bacterium]|nr:hypothetical protein [Planctomycetota bacterium]
MSTIFNSDFGNEFAQLTPEQQHQALEFVRQLSTQQSSKEQRRKAILDLAGSIPADDIERMKDAIEEGCGRVDSDGW